MSLAQTALLSFRHKSPKAPMLRCASSFPKNLRCANLFLGALFFHLEGSLALSRSRFCAQSRNCPHNGQFRSSGVCRNPTGVVGRTYALTLFPQNLLLRKIFAGALFTFQQRGCWYLLASAQSTPLKGSPASAALVRCLRRRAVGLRTSSFPSSTILRPCAFA